MSWFVAGPEAVAAAANNLADIGSTISEANGSAATHTAEMPAAAADQVSAAVATFWGAHAQGYQEISAQMASFHDKFVQALASGGALYAATEAAAAAPLQNLINAPARDLLGG